MSQIFDELREESRKEGIKKGKIEGKMEMITKMLIDNTFTSQKISEISGLSVEIIESIRLKLAN